MKEGIQLTSNSQRWWIYLNENTVSLEAALEDKDHETERVRWLALGHT
jgi:hypothetical protein